MSKIKNNSSINKSNGDNLTSHVDYNSILNILDQKFRLVRKKEKNYFVNDRDNVVASYDDNSITMYFQFPKSDVEIWNHDGIVVATFVRDFQVNELIADVIIVEGLTGSANDTKIIKNYGYLPFRNNEVFKDSKQSQFERLSYDEKIKVLEYLTGAKFTNSIIDGIKLFEEKFASCGEITASNGFASIRLSEEMEIKNIKVNTSFVGFDLNILNVNGINKDFNFEEVYNFWRNIYDWNYTTGKNFVSSAEIIEWTERRKESTVDSESINYVHPVNWDILDQMYYDSKGTVYSRRLMMKHFLSQYFSENDINMFMKKYSSNQRQIDIKKERTKKLRNRV